jgi:hypothetical protein
VATDSSELVAQLKAIAEEQKNSKDSITKAINQLSKVILMAAEEGFDMAAVIEAINGLKGQMSESTRMPTDYQIDFERDKHGLFKTGIKLSAVPKRLN